MEGGGSAILMGIFSHFVVLDLVICSLFMATSSSSTVAAASTMDTSTAVLIRVDPSGQGDFEKIQDAIDSVPSNNSQFVFILIKPGTYKEKITVPVDKPYITLSGTQAYNTRIAWDDFGGIFDSPTLSVFASDFVGRYLTIENTHGKMNKAVALRVTGDRAAFSNCRILSYQDTLLDDSGRHYYNNCYIEGATDFIFGDATSLFEKCHLQSVAEGLGAITAQKRESPSEDTGFIFLGGKITSNDTGMVLLGRPWGAYSRVIYAFTYMSSAVSPIGWNDWGDSKRQSTAYYGEYKCYGPGANRTQRAAWSRSLTSKEAAPFLTKDMIGGRGWLRPVPTHFKKGFSAMAVEADENT
ncbi:Putative pectinesterase 11 [Ancistrocladus abbreviatus]